MAENHHDDDKTHTHIPLMKDTMVGHYRIVEKIGSGGMGEVYLALDTKLNRKVALKFLPPHLCQDEDCRKRFTREAQAAAKLSHPNIIHVYEVSEYQGRPFFAMEHVEGRSLREIKAEELDIDRIVGIAIQLCDGLQTAHAAGVIHRDIKPSNIIIDSSGRPKLLDFGLATVKGGEHLTKTGSTLGTIGYMSPEQIEGKATDARADLFSLGVVLYELIADKSPFRRDDEAATLKAILHDVPEPLARYKSDVPDELQRVVSKLLEKDPSLRYQSAAGVIPDLKKLPSASVNSLAVQPKSGRWNRLVVSSAVIILLAVLAVWYFGYRDQTPATSSADDKIRLAVLPFKNLGAPEDEYFADGVTEEILSRLAAIRSLGVISSTSSFSYKNTTKTMRQISSELSVDYILEGNIRWDKSGEEGVVRVTPQLIQADGDIHIWSKSYDEVITNVFNVQSHIAGQIASVLNIQLTASEESQVSSVPTQNIEAYDYYLRGNKYFEEYTESSLNNSLQMYRKAIALDPEFAMAYVRLSITHTDMYWHGHDVSESRLDSAEASIAAAARISPNLPEIDLARGIYYYRGLDDFQRGLRVLRGVSQFLPNNSQLHTNVAWMLAHLGRWKEAEAEFKQAIRLSPRDPRGLNGLAVLLTNLRRYREADSVLNSLIEMQPDYTTAYKNKITLSRYLTGSTEQGRQILNDAKFRTGEDLTCDRWWLDIFDHKYESALSILLENRTFECSWLTKHEWFVEMADCYRFLGQSEQAEVYYDSARVLIEAEVSRAAPAWQSWNQSYLAYVYAALGRREDALREGELSVEVRPVAEDALAAPVKHEILARTYTLLGEYELAIDQLEFLASIPGGLPSLPYLKSAYFEPLQGHPRFEALIAKHEKERGT